MTIIADNDLGAAFEKVSAATRFPSQMLTTVRLWPFGGGWWQQPRTRTCNAKWCTTDSMKDNVAHDGGPLWQGCNDFGTGWDFKSWLSQSSVRWIFPHIEDWQKSRYRHVSMYESTAERTPQYCLCTHLLPFLLAKKIPHIRVKQDLLLLVPASK